MIAEEICPSPWEEIDRRARLETQGKTHGIALLSTDGDTLTYGQLARGMDAVAARLRQLGIAPGETVVIVSPAGVDYGVLLLAITRDWACAPVNPALTSHELDALFKKMSAKALVVHPRFAETAALGRRLGLPVIVATHAAPETWTVSRGQGLVALDEPAAIVGTGVLLATSATTGPRKLVPLSHGNLRASVGATLTALGLGDADRVLSLVPLFHLQGILSVLSQLAAGGSVILPTGFDRGAFPSWLETLRPTWYTCGPTLHRTLCALVNSRQNPEARTERPRSLRFVRSIGAALSVPLATEIARSLGVPVLNGYGLTETGMVASLPPAFARTHADSVGKSAGAAIRIVDSAGTSMPPGAEGEIVVRGAGVARGYLQEAAANAHSFRGGWFHTGDLGHLDGDGFLYVTGRLKEVINVGGLKVHPAEVDDVLLEHPSVAEAATFGLPDHKRGELVGCAVVLRPGTTVGEPALRAFAARHLTRYKLPRRIVFVASIPRGATGKPQRHRVAQECMEILKESMA